jgi:hypothetical protein
VVIRSRAASGTVVKTAARSGRRVRGSVSPRRPARAARVKRTLRGILFLSGAGYAASSYSWMSPPSRSRRCNRASANGSAGVAGSSAGGGFASGGRWARERCGLCARRELDPETDQLALDPSVPPARVLAGEPHNEVAHPADVGGRRGRRRGYVQRRAISSRCQRRSVPGVTNSDRFLACRGSTRLNAANNARSAGVSAGRATCRSSTRS